MSNHRADKRAVSRRRSVDVRGTYDSSAPRPVEQPVVERSGSTAGKRRAVKPGRSEQRATAGASRGQGSEYPRRSAQNAHSGNSFRADPDRRRGPRPGRRRAVTVSAPDTGSRLASGHVQRLSGQASVLSGASSISSSSSLSGRARAVSRDSQREALQDAADQDLQAAAEEQAKERNAALAALAASAEKQAAQIAKNQWQLPVTAGVYHLTARFGDCSACGRTATPASTSRPPPAPRSTRSPAARSPRPATPAPTATRPIDDARGRHRALVLPPDRDRRLPSAQHVAAGQVIGNVGSTGNSPARTCTSRSAPAAATRSTRTPALVAHGVQP